MAEQTRIKTLRAEDLGNTGLKGEFKGTETFQNKFGNQQTAHKIGDQKLYGSAALDRVLSTVKEGSTVTVKYLGKKELANGRSIKEFDVKVG